MFCSGSKLSDKLGREQGEKPHASVKLSGFGLWFDVSFYIHSSRTVNSPSFCTKLAMFTIFFTLLTPAVKEQLAISFLFFF